MLKSMNPDSIAYLNVEIPAISTTFIYNEILSLEKHGFIVHPIALHPTTLKDIPQYLTTLSDKVIVLYKKNKILELLGFIGTNFLSLLSSPALYTRAVILLLRDILSVGIAQKESLKLLYHFLHASRVSLILKRNRCFHMHAHFSSSTTQIAMYASCMSGVPFSFTSHAVDLFLNPILLKEKVSRSKAAITISKYNEELLKNLGADKKKIHVIRCGVNIDKWVFDPREKFRQIPKIGTLCRLVEKKGVDVLIEALSLLKEQDFAFTFEIVGDGPEKKKLSQMVLDRELDDSTSFLGAISNYKIPDWLYEIDIFVLACRKTNDGDQDGIPVALMEAMSIGIPVISTSISGISELIEDGISGFLAKPNDPITLAKKIKHLIYERNDLKFITTNARFRIEEEFSEALNIQRLINIFRS